MTEKTSLDRLSGEKTPLDRLSMDKLADKLETPEKRLERMPERYVRAEADVGSGVKGRGSERLEEASSNGEHFRNTSSCRFKKKRRGPQFCYSFFL